MSDKTKEILYRELELKNNLTVEGVRFEPKIFEETIKKDKTIAATHNCMDFSQDDVAKEQIIMPGGFRLEHGIGVQLNKNTESPYYIEAEDGRFYIKRDNKILSEIRITKPADFLNLTTSDGVSMRTIAQAGNGEYGDRQLSIVYSNECALKEKGLDCLFCNINATKKRFAEKENIQWKTPKQIAETVKAAYAQGYNHLTISGGYIPERRELEYYLDAAEEIKEALGQETFNGTACIGAPEDLSVLEKYKEAGFSSVGINLEVWNRHFFETICPGKSQLAGGYDKWREAIDYAVEIFGKGNVRSNFVPGLEPKESLLEGIETLAANGVVASASLPWIPNIGSALEGHRTPTAKWHWDVQQKIYQILKKNGRTFQEVYNATAGAIMLHDFFKIEEGILTI